MIKTIETEVKPIIRVLVGLPRSGKTTYAKELPGVKVSADNLRYIIYGQRFYSGGEPMVWAIRTHILKMLMQQKVDIVIDETNTTVERRKAITDLAKKYGYSTIGIHVSTSKEECIRRAVFSNDYTIVEVIHRMADQFELIQQEEFDAFYTVDRSERSS